LTQLNSITIAKELNKCTGIASVKNISGGRLLITVSSPGHLKSIKAIDKLAGAHIEFSELSREKHCECVIN